MMKQWGWVALLGLGCVTVGHASQGLLRVSSVYEDRSDARLVRFAGSAFSVAMLDSMGRMRFFAVTASHVGQGLGLDISTREGIPCKIKGQLAHNDVDIQIAEIDDCIWSPTFRYFEDAGFLGGIEESTVPQGMVEKSNGNLVHVVPAGSNVSVERYTSWHNLVGDYISNLPIVPGQSGSPYVEVLPPRRAIRKGPVTYNLVLQGIAKGSWRFFGISKSVGVDELKKLMRQFLQGQRGYATATRWQMRYGFLNQEIDIETRDWGLQFATSGNSLSVDSGAEAHPRHRALNQTSGTIRDFEFYSKLNHGLGMIYRGVPTLAFRVELGCVPGKEIFVYASLANLNFITSRPKDFIFKGSVIRYGDLRPYLYQRYGMAARNFETRYAYRLRQLGFDVRRPIWTGDLFRVESDKKRVWGRDFRNILFIDFEEIERTGEPVCRTVEREWRTGFIKAFGFHANTSKTAVVLKEIVVQ